MSGRRWWTVLLAAVLAGCASEGGVTGTGIAASVSGRVVQVGAAPNGPLPYPIRVTVEASPAVTAVAGDDGTFVLRGPFSGAVTLLFADGRTGVPIGPLALEVPAGSVTLLENVAIDPALPPEARVQPLAVRQLDVVGRIDLVECAGDGGTLLVRDAASPPRQFLVALGPDTEMLARDGSPLDCAALRPEQRVGLEGFLRPRAQSLVATRLVVTPPPPAAPDAPRRERFSGSVRALDCDRGELLLDQRAEGDVIHRRIALGESTAVRCGTDPVRACGCADIAVGDGVAGSGTIDPRRPGLVAADALTITSAPRVTLIGTLALVECGRSELVVQNAAAGGRTVRVALSPATVVQCGRRACACAALALRDRVRVEGVLLDVDPPLLAASAVSVLAQSRPAVSP